MARSGGGAGSSSDEATSLDRLLAGSITFGELVAMWVADRASCAAFESEEERERETKLARKVLLKLLDSGASGEAVLFYVNHTEGGAAGAALRIEDIPIDDRFVALSPDHVIAGVGTTD